MKEIREIKKNEKIQNNKDDKKEYGFMKIKPESKITMEEAQDFFQKLWDNR
jgi:hypothetical protein|nr:MAG TPA: hypothetical protein [Caudoviricetes sp.]